MTNGCGSIDIGNGHAKAIKPSGQCMGGLQIDIIANLTLWLAAGLRMWSEVFQLRKWLTDRHNGSDS